MSAMAHLQVRQSGRMGMVLMRSGARMAWEAHPMAASISLRASTPIRSDEPMGTSVTRPRMLEEARPKGHHLPDPLQGALDGHAHADVVPGQVPQAPDLGGVAVGHQDGRIAQAQGADSLADDTSVHDGRVHHHLCPSADVVTLLPLSRPGEQLGGPGGGELEWNPVVE